MSSQTYPLSLPGELLEELRTLAAEAGLSVADVLRQAAKLGLPELRAKLCPEKGGELIVVELESGKRKLYVGRRLVATVSPGEQFSFDRAILWEKIIFARRGQRQKTASK